MNLFDPEARCVAQIESPVHNAAVHPVPADNRGAGEEETSVAGEGGRNTEDAWWSELIRQGGATADRGSGSCKEDTVGAEPGYAVTVDCQGGPWSDRGAWAEEEDSGEGDGVDEESEATWFVELVVRVATRAPPAKAGGADRAGPMRRSGR